MKKIVIAVRGTSEGEDLRVFDSYDEVFGLYDYIEEKFVSPTTYKKLQEGYTPCRYGNTVRAYNL
jgi:hypothetical protein